MGRVEVKDHVLWLKRLHGDPSLKARIEALEPDQTIDLVVDGFVGTWRKMRANRQGGYKTPGLAPLGAAKQRWGLLYRQSKDRGGAVVEVDVANKDQSDREQKGRWTAPGATWATDSEAERQAAWEAVQASWSAGWRSTEDYGPRDALHERGKK